MESSGSEPSNASKNDAPVIDVDEDNLKERVDSVDGESVEQVKKGGGRKRSYVWKHFTKDEKTGKATCSFCKNELAAHSKTNGTSVMNNHLQLYCKNSPYRNQVDKKQRTLAYKAPNSEQGSGVLATHKFSQEKCRNLLARMCIKDNRPFSVADDEGLKEFVWELNPMFKFPSRWTIARDCMKIYQEERKKLKVYLKDQMVSLTTDTWTSVQNLNYMCLTAHWIDDDWVLRKKILNFCLISNHKADTIGGLVYRCLDEWDIERVFTVTVDNASPNDGAINKLKKLLKGPHSVLDCKSSATNLVDDDESEDLEFEDDYQKYLEEQGAVKLDNNEVEVYLRDGMESRTDDTFDVLGWWKINSMEFPILSQIAKHVLAMPISTVASESAFSTGGRIIDKYRSSLTPKTAESLICVQDWLRATPLDLQDSNMHGEQLEDLVENLENIEDDLLDKKKARKDSTVEDEDRD